MRERIRVHVTIAILALLMGCQGPSERIQITAEDFHAAVDKASEVMVHDIFSPPVASRVFAYPNIAAYEIIAQQDPRYQSLSGQISHMPAIPAADTSAAPVDTSQGRYQETEHVRRVYQLARF